MQEATIATIGCDLGERQSTVYVLWPDGSVERPGPVKTTKAAMEEFFARPTAHVVIEVGTHSRWVSCSSIAWFAEALNRDLYPNFGPGLSE